MQKIDFLVIGAGVMGLALSWRLAKAGKSVVLVDKGTCGSGASLASLGALMPYSPWHDEPLSHAQHHSLWSYPEFVGELKADTGIDPRYRKLGRLQFLSSEHQLDNYTLGAQIAVDTWPHSGAGDVVSVLSQEAACQKEPEIECSEYGVAFCQNTAHVSVDHLVAALRSACMKFGVDIRENCQAHELLFVGGQVSGAGTSMGPVHAETTVLAAGAWSKALLPDDEPLVKPVKGQAIMLQGKKPLLKHLLRGRGVYVVPIEHNRFLVGATKEPKEGFDATPTQEGLDWLLERAESLVPALAEAEVMKHWAGLRPQSEVRIPVVDFHDDYKNLFMLTGHGGIGICMLPGATKMALEKLLK